MIWFGSSAGVAITNKFPEGRDVIQWVKKGWHVAVAFLIGFFTLYLIMGWEPADNKEHKIINCPVPGCPMANKHEVPKSLTTEEASIFLSFPGKVSFLQE